MELFGLSGSFVKTSKRLSGERPCDAVKRSLDVGINLVNLTRIRGIKALSRARLKAAQPMRNDSIIGVKLKPQGPAKIFP